MKRCVYVCLLLMSVLFLAACTTTAMQQDELGPWLEEMSGDKEAAIDIEGRWQDAQGQSAFDWGRGKIEQDGNQLEGYLGEYKLQGMVSGDKVYLAMVYEGEVYYTARLEKDEEYLEGEYFDASDREQARGRAMVLESIER
ncbi:MAG: hypothetical protein ACLFOA_06365 [Desulfohalobiaceae bacterium]